MSGHRGLRQAAALINLTGADTVLVAVGLVGKFDVRVFEPVQDFSPYWVCQGFYYFVEVKGHEWQLVMGLQWIKRYIAMRRTLNRYFAIYKYGFDLDAE